MINAVSLPCKVGEGAATFNTAAILEHALHTTFPGPLCRESFLCSVCQPFPLKEKPPLFYHHYLVGCDPLSQLEAIHYKTP